MKKMLIVIAHPSDEAFVFGGTIAKYARAGWTVQLLCATNGEAGSSGTFTWAVGDALGALRQEELTKSKKILGIKEVAFLGHRDGQLAQLTPGTLEDPIHDAMTDFQPDVVLTFDTIGVNNDPDHIKISYAATFAFQKYAEHLETLKDPAFLTRGRGKAYKQEEVLRAFGQTGDFDKEPKLYYAVFPESIVAYLQKAGLFYRESFELPWKGTDDKFITTVIDIENYKGIKAKALASHQTQQEDIEKFLAFPANPLMKQEYFILRMQGIHEVLMGKTDRVSDRI